MLHATKQRLYRAKQEAAWLSNESTELRSAPELLCSLK